jgi:DNA-binding GntR family transcriptional regulator
VHDTRAALEPDNDFHLVWISKSESQELARILADLKTKLRRLELAHFDSGDAMESVNEHTQIIKELRSKHRTNAARALEKTGRA